MICKGHADISTVFPGWVIVQHFPALGHYISNNGASDHCWQETRDSLCRSFWSNCGGVLDKGDVTAKLRLLKRTALPRLQFVCPRWAFTATRARALDHTQRKMIMIILATKKQSGEDSDRFFRRRDLEAGRVARREGLWSHDWVNKLLSWSDHLARPRNALNPVARLYKEQDSAWLQLQRLQFVSAARSLFAGGTGTRLLAQPPAARWECSLHSALDWIQR